MNPKKGHTGKSMDQLHEFMKVNKLKAAQTYGRREGDEGLWTWRRGTLQSQIDYVLCSEDMDGDD